MHAWRCGELDWMIFDYLFLLFISFSTGRRSLQARIEPTSQRARSQLPTGGASVSTGDVHLAALPNVAMNLHTRSVDAPAGAAPNVVSLMPLDASFGMYAGASPSTRNAVHHHCTLASLLTSLQLASLTLTLAPSLFPSALIGIATAAAEEGLAATILCVAAESVVDSYR